MIVMKFGGTSVGSAQSIRDVLALVRAHEARRPVVVVSAHSGVTNALVELAAKAPRGQADPGPVVDRHRAILAELGLPLDLHEPLLRELRDLLRGMKLVGEASPRATDYLLSFGERLSARTIAAFFSRENTPATAIDAFDAGLVTDSNFGRARPLPDEGEIAARLAAVAGIPIVTGYLAKDRAGNITTLGRNGSDYSAAIFGAALDCEEIQIWTDVDGVMTADPRIVPNAKPIVAMSLDEASELAYYGGKVLHPATIQPAMKKSIPVRVLNTKRPQSKGTVILPHFEEPEVVVRAIVHRQDIHMVTVTTPRMLQQPGYLARVFQACADHAVDVDLVATSEVSVTMTTDRAEALEALRTDLSRLGTVTIESEHAIVCVVGQGIGRTPGVPGQVFTALADAKVRVRVISQGAIKVNIAMVVANADAHTAVRALHVRFFGT